MMNELNLFNQSYKVYILRDYVSLRPKYFIQIKIQIHIRSLREHAMVNFIAKRKLSFVLSMTKGNGLSMDISNIFFIYYFILFLFFHGGFSIASGTHKLFYFII